MILSKPIFKHGNSKNIIERDLCMESVDSQTRWKIGETNGIVVAGGHGKGNRLDQLDRPTYLCVDQSNNRVMKWAKNAVEGIVVAAHSSE